MTSEDQLDGLIERWERGVPLGPITSDQIEVRLAAAEALAQLQAIVVPLAFAAHLEIRVRARARSLAQQRGRVIAFPGSEAPRGRRQRTEQKRKREAVSHARRW